jgi:hypothetical protein
LQNFHGDIDSAIKWTLDCAVIKPNSLINYKLPYERNYNSKSLENLLNQTNDETKQTTYLEIKKKEKINNVNKWANDFKNNIQEKLGELIQVYSVNKQVLKSLKLALVLLGLYLVSIIICWVLISEFCLLLRSLLRKIKSIQTRLLQKFYRLHRPFKKS